MCLRAFASVKPSTFLKTSTTYDIRFTGSLTTTTSHGCAGWGAGQLEYELGENTWLTAPVDPELLFELPLERRWQTAAGRIGVDLFMLADYSGHA